MRMLIAVKREVGEISFQVQMTLSRAKRRGRRPGSAEL